MSYNRKVLRSQCKKMQGNNKIKATWREFQIKKYGIGLWCKMFNKCNRNPNNKANKVEPSNAHWA